MHSIFFCHVKQIKQHKKRPKHKSDINFHDPHRYEVATFPSYLHQMIAEIQAPKFKSNKTSVVATTIAQCQQFIKVKKSIERRGDSELAIEQNG
jgi:hypothetical protein